MSDEKWRPVLGYEGKYEVSIIGRVRSLVARDAPLIMKQILRKDGYMQVQLKVNQRPNNRLVHTLVDEAFNGERINGKEVNHIDGNKRNNRLSNLVRVTRKENVQHAFQVGLCGIRKGEQNKNCTIPYETVTAIRSESVSRRNGRFKRGELARLSEKYRVSTGYIRRIILGEERRNA